MAEFDLKISELPKVPEGALTLETEFAVARPGEPETESSTIGAILALFGKGTELFVQVGNPNASVGVDKDSWLDSSTGNIWKKVGDTWIVQYQPKPVKSISTNNGVPVLPDNTGNINITITSAGTLYQEWLDQGNTGTFNDFLNTLRGPEGLNAYQVWLLTNPGKSVEEYYAFLKGTPGLNGIDAWLALNPGKTIADYELAFKGPAGQNGINGTNGAAGYTPVKNVDYFDGQPGVPGLNGAPGEKAVPWIIVGPLVGVEVLPPGGPPEYAYRIYNNIDNQWHIWAYEVGPAEWFDYGPIGNYTIIEGAFFVPIPENHFESYGGPHPAFNTQDALNVWLLQRSLAQQNTVSTQNTGWILVDDFNNTGQAV